MSSTSWKLTNPDDANPPIYKRRHPTPYRRLYEYPDAEINRNRNDVIESDGKRKRKTERILHNRLAEILDWQDSSRWLIDELSTAKRGISELLPDSEVPRTLHYEKSLKGKARVDIAIEEDTEDGSSGAVLAIEVKTSPYLTGYQKKRTGIYKKPLVYVCFERHVSQIENQIKENYTAGNPVWIWTLEQACRDLRERVEVPESRSVDWISDGDIFRRAVDTFHSGLPSRHGEFGTDLHRANKALEYLNKLGDADEYRWSKHSWSLNVEGSYPYMSKALGRRHTLIAVEDEDQGKDSTDFLMTIMKRGFEADELSRDERHERGRIDDFVEDQNIEIAKSKECATSFLALKRAMWSAYYAGPDSSEFEDLKCKISLGQTVHLKLAG